MGNPLYFEEEVLRRIKKLCAKAGVAVKKIETREGPVLELYKGRKRIGTPLEYGIKMEGKIKLVQEKYIPQLSKKLYHYLSKYKSSITLRNILTILGEKKQVSKKRLEELVEGAVGAFVILAIIAMGFARNITSFAIYEKEKFNAPVVWILVSLGILLILIYYLSKKV